MTCRSMAISCLVPSSIWFIIEDSVLSVARSIILAANSRPVSFSMHRLTVELIPLKNNKKKKWRGVAINYQRNADRLSKSWLVPPVVVDEIGEWREICDGRFHLGKTLHMHRHRTDHICFKLYALHGWWMVMRRQMVLLFIITANCRVNDCWDWIEYFSGQLRYPYQWIPWSSPVHWTLTWTTMANAKIMLRLRCW